MIKIIILDILNFIQMRVLHNNNFNKTSTQTKSYNQTFSLKILKVQIKFLHSRQRKNRCVV